MTKKPSFTISSNDFGYSREEVEKAFNELAYYAHGGEITLKSGDVRIDPPHSFELSKRTADVLLAAIRDSYLKQQTKMYYCVTSSVDENGFVKALVSHYAECTQRPENTLTLTDREDIYRDWFESIEDAENFIVSVKSESLSNEDEDYDMEL